METLRRSAFWNTAVVLLTMSIAHAQQPCLPPPALRSGQNSADGAGAAGNWFSHHGQARCAMQAYRHGLQVAPGSAALHYSLGVTLLGEHEVSAAQAELEQALRLEPSFDRAYLVLGVIAHDRGDRDVALHDWQRAVEINPSSTLALDWIAKTRIESGQYTAAADLLRTAPVAEDLAVDLLVADSKANLYIEAIATGKRSLGSHENWNRLRVALATVLAQRNQFEDAVSLLQAAQQRSPDAFDIQVQYLRVLVLMGDTKRSEPYAEQLLAAYPQAFDVLYLNGLLKRQAGAYIEALGLLQKAHALRPEHFDVQFNLGTTLAKLHRTQEAKEQLMHAAGLAEASPEVHFQLAAVLRSLGEVDAAEQEKKQYQQQLAERAARDERISLSAQVSQRLSAGDAPGAIALEEQIVAKYPEEAVPWYDLALALDAVKDYAGEGKALQRAVQLRPGFAVALNQLGYLQAQANDPAQAESSFRAALASAPQYAEAENNLGSLLAGQGKDAEAEQYFRSALQANPRYLEAWINLAASLAARGDMKEARHAAESAMTVQPGNKDAAQLLSMIASAAVASK